MSYKIETQPGKKYALIEEKTGFIVQIAEKPSPLKPIKNFLKKGGGFAGFTPEFVQKPVPPHLLKK